MKVLGCLSYMVYYLFIVSFWKKNSDTDVVFLFACILLHVYFILFGFFLGGGQDLLCFGLFGLLEEGLK